MTILSCKALCFCLVLLGFTADAQETKIHSLPMPNPARKRLTEKTMLFPRIQSKYDLMYNYLDGYTLDTQTFFDRPLFFDRTLGEEPPQLYDKLNSPKGFCRDLDSALEFTSGFAIFLATRLARTERPLRFASEGGYENALLLEATPPSLKKTDEMMTQIDLALKTKAAVRCQGRLMISSYHGEVFTPAQWSEALKPYREKYGDAILFTAELRGCGYQLNTLFNKNGGYVTTDDINKIKTRIRSYLEVLDGVNFSASNHLITQAAGFPENVFNAECYEKIIVPIFADVLSEPAYNGKKVLGLSAHRCYAQVRHTGSNVDEMGTRGLRQSLSAALSANPDYIIMPEWNEVNENTHIQPLVGNAKSTPRVVNAMTGRATKDVERIFPNVILSFRSDNAIGAPIPIELLGLPDEGGDSQIILRLLDEQGKTLKEFPSVTFSHKAIEEAFHLEESGRYSEHRFLMPELDITWNGKRQLLRDGLPCIRISTPPVQLMTYAKLPLRDLPSPTDIQAEILINGEDITAKGKFNLPDKVAYIELLANDTPIAVVCQKDEYAAPEGMLTVCWQRNGPVTTSIPPGELSITALKGKIQRRDSFVYGMAGMAVPEQNGNTLKVPVGGGSFCRECFFHTTSDALLEVSERGEKTVVSIQESLVKNGRFRVLDSCGVSWQLLLKKDLKEMPLPLDANNGSFKLNAKKSDRFNAVYCVRVVTREGRVFRSRPVMAEHPDAERLSVPVLNLLQNSRDLLKVPSKLVRDVRFRFSPEAGALMLAEDGRREHDAVLGGFDYRTHGQPGWNLLYAPEWRQYNGDKWELHFDKGAGLFLGPPIFSRSAFTIELDVAFDDVRDQTLLDVIGGRMPVCIKDGRLQGAVTPVKRSFKWSAPEQYAIEANRFYHIVLRYDLERLNCWADGEEAASIPFSGTFSDGWCLCIGGVPVNAVKATQKGDIPNDGFNFKGTLRSLRICNF
ncbi:MAG: hypothetical protein IJS15_01885 [Victivallales bacterium]|nr:hypothetical protein [Victivallales bacterium]